MVVLLDAASEETSLRDHCPVTGTVYPLMSSLLAVSTPEDADDVVWLTY
jgi:hypothetical protein